MSAQRPERRAAPTTDARDRTPAVDRERTPGRRRRDAPPLPATHAPLEFGVGAGRLGTTLGRAMLAWPGRDPLRRSDRR